MLNFSLIPPHLQVQIAEKVNYFDQKEFELTSKHAKGVIDLQKHQPFVELNYIWLDKKEMRMAIMRNNEMHRFRWSQIRKMEKLPRFRIQEVRIKDNCSLIEVTEFCERADFIQRKVYFSFDDELCIDSDFDEVSKLFKITDVAFRLTEELEEDIVPLLQKFSKLEFVDIRIRSRTKKEYLRHLLCPKMLFAYTRKRGMVSTANFFFQEWLQKTRKIDWFKIEWFTSYRAHTSFTEKTLFMGLPFSIIWKHKKKHQPEQVLLKRSDDSEKLYNLYDKDVIYSIDRGDRKLMVFISDSSSFVLSQEYIDLKDVIEIGETKFNW